MPVIEYAAMGKSGIDHSTCPQARVVAAICSPAEIKFSKALKQALRSKVIILLKVRVLDVIQLIDEPDQRRMRFWRDHLADKFFDYLVCSKETLAPLLAVELENDRPNHGASTRDLVKLTAARRAHFPLIRISAGNTYVPLVLRQTLIDSYRQTKQGPLPSEMD